MCPLLQVALQNGSVELKLPLLKSEEASDNEDDDRIVVDTTHEITYGDLGESRSNKARAFFDVQQCFTHEKIDLGSF